jgi:hypothetical protein
VRRYRFKKVLNDEVERLAWEIDNRSREKHRRQDRRRYRLMGYSAAEVRSRPRIWRVDSCEPGLVPEPEKGIITAQLPRTMGPLPVLRSRTCGAPPGVALTNVPRAAIVCAVIPPGMKFARFAFEPSGRMKSDV